MSEIEEPQPWPFADSDLHGWPTAGSQQDKPAAEAEIHKSQLEVRVKRAEQEIARAKVSTDARAAIEAEYFKSVLDVAKGSIDRARASADTVQKASAAIVSLYTGVLAVAFSVADNPLPGKALFAAVLLGLAILFSTAFLAFLPDDGPGDDEQPAIEGNMESAGERFTNTFVRWTRKTALARARLLRASVIALAGAVALLPAPFVAFGEKAAPKESVEWPPPRLAAGESVQLAKIVYAAEIAEAAEQRKQPGAKESDDWLWTLVFVAALAATAAVWILPRPQKTPKEDLA